MHLQDMKPLINSTT